MITACMNDYKAITSISDSSILDKHTLGACLTLTDNQSIFMYVIL